MRQPRLQITKPLGIGVVALIAMMNDIGRDVAVALSYGDNGLSERVGDPSFVEDVGILAAVIADHCMTSENKAEHVLDDGRVIPQVVGTLSVEMIGVGASPPNRFIDTVEGWAEGHHHGDQPRVLRRIGNTKDRRCETDALT